MKKIVKLLVLGTCVALVAAGCKAKDTNTGGSTAASQSNAIEKAAGPTVGDVTLGKYKGIEVTALSTEVTEEEIEAAIAQALDNNPSLEEVTDRPVQKDDVVNINYKGTKDGVPFEGGSADKYDLAIGSGDLGMEIEEGLIGAQIGETKKVSFTFPEGLGGEELSGQPVEFEVLVNSINIKKPAELNDEFVQTVSKSEVKTVEEYRKGLKENLIQNKKESAEQKKKSDVVQAVVMGAEIAKYNQEDIDKAAEQVKNEYSYYAQMLGTTLEGYITGMGMTKEDFEKQAQELGKNTVATSLVMKAIAEVEKISITPDDLKAGAELYGFATPEEFTAQYGEEAVNEALLVEKVVNYLCDNAVIK